LSCEHIAAAVDQPMPTVEGCPTCLAQGVDDWVHLRQCLACGNVGCCDSSPRRHASAHNAATQHPVIRSLEPGESWRWCYLDETIG
jgi:uncharacterized UBP type Zn finger protein